MIVIKLGGSLLASGKLAQCLDTIECNYQGRAVVVVPGGGLFADQVRLAQKQWQFNDEIAHRMAILAMRQMSLLMQGISQNFVLTESCQEILAKSAENPRMIWSPVLAELDAAGIPATWSISSDSLAAWLAGEVKAEELIVVKSASIEPNYSLKKLVDDRIVDDSFSDYCSTTPFKLTIVQAETFLSQLFPS